MSPDRITFVHRWFEEVWNNGNLDAVDELMAPTRRCTDAVTGLA